MNERCSNILVVHMINSLVYLLLLYGTVSSKITILDRFSKFQFFFSFSVNSKVHLSNGPYASYIGLSIINLLGTEFIISCTFQCEFYFSFACPGKI